MQKEKWSVLVWIAVIVAIALLTWVFLMINRAIFKRARKKSNRLHLALFERLIACAIVVVSILLSVSALSGAQAVWKTLLSGTAITSAVLAFVAQDIIKDVLAGIMISVSKPFDIGDRIVLEDGTSGTVKNITLRHVVLASIDTACFVIPNSKINAMKLTSYSFGRSDRSIHFRFSVGYGTDPEFAKQVIGQAVEESPYSMPREYAGNGSDVYSPVYFISYAASALIMAVTVYYAANVSTETVMDDINTRVRAALNKNGIEIPYDHVTVITEK